MRDGAVAMKLVFTKNSPLNTTLVDERSGAVMYEIETEGGFFGSKRTIVRKPVTSASLFFSITLLLAPLTNDVLGRPPSSDQRGQPIPRTSSEVARIQWKRWSSDRIVYYGHEMKRDEFLPKAGMFSE